MMKTVVFLVLIATSLAMSHKEGYKQEQTKRDWDDEEEEEEEKVGEDICDPLVRCPLYSGPVCGSDHKTYGNECYFKKAVCKNPKLQQAHSGKCKTVENLNLF